MLLRTGSKRYNKWIMQNKCVPESYDRNNLVNVHPMISMVKHKNEN